MNAAAASWLRRGWEGIAGALSSAPPVSERTALVVWNRSSRLFHDKVRVFEGFLVAAAQARRVELVPASRQALPRLNRPGVADDAAARQCAAGLGTSQVLLVSIQDFTAVPDARHRGDLENLRVDATLCVSTRLVDCASGRVLEARNLALSRRTTPVVAGTKVGSRVLDVLLAELAFQIASRCALSVRVA